MSTVHPPTKEVPLSGGPTVRVRPWTMAQRADLRPKVASLLEAISKLEGGFQAGLSLNLVTMFVHVEDEVCDIVRSSIPKDELNDEAWNAMEWADLPNLAQAVWELNVARSDGMLGKIGTALGTMMGKALVQAAQNQAGGAEADLAGHLAGSGESPSQTPQRPTSLRPAPSPSSPGAGEAIPSG